MVYTDACNQAECVKRSELAIAVVSVARIQEPVVMVALRRQCRIMTNNYSSIEQPAEEARTQWGEDVRPLRKRKINQLFKKRQLTPPLYAYGWKCWKHGCNVMSDLVYNYARFRVRQWIFNVVAVATLDR